MDPREKRLAKLLAVHGQMKALHESRRAGFLRSAAQAKLEAETLIGRFDAPDALSGLFPEIYHARIAAAWRREAEGNALAQEEAGKLAGISLREKAIREELREVRARLERAGTERAVLDWVETRPAAKC